MALSLPLGDIPKYGNKCFSPSPRSFRYGVLQDFIFSSLLFDVYLWPVGERECCVLACRVISVWITLSASSPFCYRREVFEGMGQNSECNFPWNGVRFANIIYSLEVTLFTDSLVLGWYVGSLEATTFRFCCRLLHRKSCLCNLSADHCNSF